MTDEEKLYVLMAQAEDLQKHAVELQNKAQETFSALPLAVGPLDRLRRSFTIDLHRSRKCALPRKGATLCRRHTAMAKLPVLRLHSSIPHKPTFS